MSYRYKGKDGMLKKIEAYVSKWHMIGKGDCVITGVSGGADSVCLLFVLLELKKKIPFEVVVVHVNHGLRGVQADADEEFVRTLCQQHNLPLEICREDVAAVAKEQRKSEEEAGRDVRREAFREAMKKYHGTKIALAHHMNDNAETFLMNLSRGAGIKGIGGMRPVNEEWIRPLLCVERSEIEQYLATEEIAYCTDDTNKSDDYTRNRIRNHVIPYLEKEINVAAVAHITEVMERLQEVQMFLEEQVKIYLQTCVKETESGYILDRSIFETVPKVLKPLLIKSMLEKVSGREKDLGAVHVELLLDLLRGQVGRKADLPYEVEAKRIYEGIRLQRKRADLVKTSRGEYQVQCKIFDVCEGNLKLAEKSNTKRFDYDIISEEICVRTRQPGDYITIHSDGRTQKLKSFFINQKIPKEDRDQILLVADGSHILWIMGYRDNPVYRVQKETKKIIEIQINKGEENNGRDN